jgi:sec-independent protein translocase protein TatA
VGVIIEKMLKAVMGRDRMFPKFGPVELLLILVIVVMLFGVGKLPEVFGSVGKGIREFRRNVSDNENVTNDDATPSAPVEPLDTPSAESSDKKAAS